MLQIAYMLYQYLPKKETTTTPACCVSAMWLTATEWGAFREYAKIDKEDMPGILTMLTPAGNLLIEYPSAALQNHYLVSEAVVE